MAPPAHAQMIDRQSGAGGDAADGSGGAGLGGAAGSDAPSTQGYRQADMAMRHALDRVYTGDADRDFLTGMVPHHQGAIEIAKVALKFGKDPAVRKLAQEVIAAQEREIAEMRRMIEALDQGAPKR
jgi:uncharacterized protein (DUF305 family)